jgi:UDPglucose 6-dehydrogenase
MTTLAVIGSGYVAIVTAVCFAAMGHKVLYACTLKPELAQLQQGQPPFYEEGLEAALTTELERGTLTLTHDPTAATQAANVVFISVTALALPSGKIDLKPLHKIIPLIKKGLANSADTPKLLVERSTLPITTAEWLLAQFAQSPNVAVAAVPQFLREGHAIKDFNQPDRIIIGAQSQHAIDTLVSLFSPLRAPLLITDINSAELIKHATNAFLAMKISFINSMAQLCEHVGADVEQVAKGLGMDKRISDAFLNAGLGYGGLFLPRDLASLIQTGNDHHLSLDLLKATEVINRYQRISFMERVEAAVGGSLHGKTVALWGLAYRPNTSDMRDAPSTQVVWGLQNRGATIRAYDPLAMPAAQEKVKNVTFCQSCYEAAEGADVIAIVTEWEEFQQLNFKRLKEATQCRLIVDGRNLYNLKRMQELGFTYHSIGRPIVSA